MFGGRIGAFLVGVVTGVGVSEYCGPFFRKMQNKGQREAKNFQKQASNLYDDARDKASDFKNAAKEKMQDIKDDMRDKTKR